MFAIPYPELSDTAITYSFWLRQLPWEASGYADATFGWHTNQHAISVSKDSILFFFADSTYRSIFLETPVIRVKSRLSTSYFIHIVVVCKRTGATLYISGVKAGTIDGVLSLQGSPAGNFSGYLQNMNMDELIIYNRSLTQEEVEQLEASYSPEYPIYQTLSVQASAPEGTTSGEGVRLIISPNPTAGTFRINKEIDVENGMAVLSDLSGKEVFRTYLTTHTVTLPEKVLPGVYVFRLRTKDGKIYNTKVVVGSGNTF
ncbi:T9SS type A sorting domain-containing protein [Chitinophaga oryzae]|uniref:T9SS type A sorting domain-containing protein n=1 Tax=Chitinophaga oryzae TaxID=2725414 RepID=A0ABX6LPP0_9BACT|nr:LamG-like jellyroll fold domain-containing protein [Chitinophaga oryzae]QJB42088.1 T9SS type A sorting domain-containing protein [Chitinophaga oryzae]